MESTRPIDPVCGMEVHEDCTLIAEVEGRVYRFCSEGCRRKFLDERAKGTTRLGYDLVIIGAGPAGLAAAVYAATLKDDALLLGRDLGGQAIDSTKIENYMGYDLISGPVLISRFRDQLIHSHHLDHRIVEVVSVEARQVGFRVATNDGIAYEARALILATGMNPRRLNVPGEQEFLRRGISYGHVSDFAFMEGRRVAVIGGGNSALQMVENLEPLASRIYLVSHGSLTGDRAVVERVLQSGKLERFAQHEVVAFTGSNKLEAARIRKRGTTKETELAADGAFIAIGFSPASALVADLVDLNRRGEIKIQPDCSTSRPGIFAAGDVTDAYGKRIIVAAGEGAKAAMAAHAHLNGVSDSHST